MGDTTWSEELGVWEGWDERFDVQPAVAKTLVWDDFWGNYRHSLSSFIYRD